MTTNEIALHAGNTDLSLSPDQKRFTEAQLAALCHLGVENASQGDLDVFHHQCQRTQLDPFAKQIYMIGRRTNDKVWKNGKQVDNWVTKWTIQTGIDGYRVLGHRIADERGDDLEMPEPQWCGEDGQWRDVWVNPKTPPAAAKFVIFKNGKPYAATVHYSEFVQTNKDGSTTLMWSKMPANQLAKCAEAQAWRKAYPNDFAGLNLDVAVQTIEPDGSESPAPARRARSERVAPDVSAIMSSNSRPKPEAAQVNRRRGGVTKAQINEMSSLLDQLPDVENDADKLRFVCEYFKREIGDVRELTGDEAEQVLTSLRALVAPKDGDQAAEDGQQTPAAEDGAL